MLATIRNLWTGELSLARTFWEFTVIYGFVLNVAATGAALGMASAGQPDWLMIAVHLLPAPYMIFMLVAVWRSAERYAGPKLWAELARPVALLWALLLILIPV
jgi:hypothetical protein